MRRGALIIGVVALLGSSVVFAAPGASAAPAARARSTAQTPRLAAAYLPGGYVLSPKTDAQVHDALAALDQYGIGRLLLPLAPMAGDGTQPVSVGTHTMLARWLQRAAAYNAARGTQFEVDVVLNGRLDRGLDLDHPGTRAAIVHAVRSLVTDDGVQGVQLDLEPYPTTPGFLALLDSLNSAFADLGFTGPLAVVAPASTGVWSPSFVAAVSARVEQVVPLYYDSESTNVASYETWVKGSLSYYAANTDAAAQLVPAIPSYSSNPWHTPTVENIASATDALAAALYDGVRVDSAAIFWWWGFYLNEGGHYHGGADRAAWQAVTRSLPYWTSNGPVCRSVTAFTRTEIGSTPLPSNACVDGDRLLVGGAGNLGPTADTLPYLWQPLPGDGQITVRVQSLENTGSAARIGVMMRSSTARGARTVFLGVDGKDRVRWAARPTSTTTSAKGAQMTVPNVWLRLTRVGDVVTGSTSNDGVHYSTLRSATVALGASASIGLTVASGTPTARNDAAFTQVELSR